jgi:hypothetical protein
MPWQIRGQLRVTGHLEASRVAEDLSMMTVLAARNPRRDRTPDVVSSAIVNDDVDDTVPSSSPPRSAWSSDVVARPAPPPNTPESRWLGGPQADVYMRDLVGLGDFGLFVLFSPHKTLKKKNSQKVYINIIAHSQPCRPRRSTSMPTCGSAAPCSP